MTIFHNKDIDSITTRKLKAVTIPAAINTPKKIKKSDFKYDNFII